MNCRLFKVNEFLHGNHKNCRDKKTGMFFFFPSWGVVKIVMVVKYHTLAFKSMASPEVWDEMTGGDTGTAGDGSIVAGTGVDVDIVPPSTVKVGKAQAEELAGMTNELKRKLRELTAEQLGRSQN